VSASPEVAISAVATSAKATFALLLLLVITPSLLGVLVLAGLRL
jgi:hypothetical protein